MKKIIAVMLSIILITSVSMRISAVETDDWYAELCEQVGSDQAVNDGVSDVSMDEINEVIYGLAEGAARSASITTERKATMATLLSLKDGILASTITLILGHASAANTAAQNHVNSGVLNGNSNEQDPYRHFTWNYRCIQGNILLYSTRIVTLNYEWGTILSDDWDNKFNERYDYYYSLYWWNIVFGTQTIEGVTQLATADANDYVYNLRNAIISECRSSYSKFLDVFDDAALMDFYNNDIGRDYAATYGATKDAHTAYFMAKSDADLIMASADVASHRYAIYQTPDLWDPS